MFRLPTEPSEAKTDSTERSHRSECSTSQKVMTNNRGLTMHSGGLAGLFHSPIAWMIPGHTGPARHKILDDFETPDGLPRTRLGEFSR